MRQRRARLRGPACAVTHACHSLLPGVQLRQDTELRGHQEAVSRLAWHPTHPDRLASLGQMSESCVRCGGGKEGGGGGQMLRLCFPVAVLAVLGHGCCADADGPWERGCARLAGPAVERSPARLLPRFWDTRSGKNTATLTTPGINLSMSWSKDGQYMAVVRRRAVHCLNATGPAAFLRQAGEAASDVAPGNAASPWESTP